MPSTGVHPDPKSDTCVFYREGGEWHLRFGGDPRWGAEPNFACFYVRKVGTSKQMVEAGCGLSRAYPVQVYADGRYRPFRPI